MAGTMVAPSYDPTQSVVDPEINRRLQAALLASGQPEGGDQLSTAVPAAPVHPATLAPASLTDQPATGQVDAAQQALKDQARTAQRERLASAIMGVGGALAGGLSGSWGGRDIMQAEQASRGAQDQEIASQRQALTEQLKSAQQAQTGQYEADQRRREAVEQATTLANSRLGVGGLNLTGREYAADQGLAGRVAAANAAVTAGAGHDLARTTAATTAASAATTVGAGHDTANRAIGAGHDRARVTTGEYAADAAAGRQTRNFEHQDNKPTAAEDQRADYGHQLIQLSNDLDEIVTRRPDLVGKLAGRWTTLRGLIGTDDPDVARLNALHHQLGIISMATHGMRNGQTLEMGANSIMNGLKNSPEALHAATDQARRSAQTFTEAPIRPGATAAAPAGTLGLPKASLRQQVTAPGSEPKPDAQGFIYAKPPSGPIKRAKPGESLPKGWTYAAGPNG